MLIKNGRIHDAIHKRPYTADILLMDGRIAAIGKDLDPQGEEVLDAFGLEVYPGLVEAHGHIGTVDTGISGIQGSDNNEKGTPCVPELRAIDCIYAQDPALKLALKAGITTVCTGPGSANVIGGTFAAVKTVGNTVDEMVIKKDVAMKCAFGENPKNNYGSKGAGTRMGVAARIREALFAAKDYMLRKEEAMAAGSYSKLPKYDMKAEALIPVLKGEMPLKAHCHRADDICTAIRVAQEFGVKMTLEHVTDAQLVIEELKKADFPLAIGPIITGGRKTELRNASLSTPGVLAKAGLKVCIVTDSPVNPQYMLPIAAGLAVREGMDSFAALQAITINAAKHIGLEDRVGSLEVGKDADVVLADGDILNNLTHVKEVFVNGRKAV